MNNLQMAAVGAVALVAGASMASATTHHVVSGKIEHLDRAKHVLLLRNHSYRFNPERLALGIHEGDKVTIRYRAWRGHRTALRVAPSA